ncbi:MAG: FeoB-associated Cys-rich membrane protein [Oscillospiraceae bacterium]|nr:FeoB-associated Cys-rich membrane protein [Oscillospiraceae bacterium]
MDNIIIILVVVIIVGLAGGYVYKAKKSEQKCIGCPHSSSCNTKTEKEHGCGGNCSGCNGGCGHH